MKHPFCLSGNDLNYSSTSLVLFHRFISVAFTMFFTNLFSITLLTRPISDFVGLINLHVGAFGKFGLWSLRLMNTSFSARHSIRSSSLNQRKGRKVRRTHSN